MKKTTFLIVFAIVLMIATPGLSQIVINKSDMPQKDDTVRVSLGLNPAIIDLSETGENYTWDYSQLIPFQQRVDTFVNVTSTPAGIIFMFTSDFAVRMANLPPLPGVEISDAYQYYKSTNSAYKNTGFAISMQGFPIPASFTSPDIIYEFPLEYGNSDSSASGVAMNIPNTGYIEVDRNRVNHVDGYGTLITPYGTFDVIRVKSEVTEYDSIYLESQETGVALPYSYTEYKWLGKNQKAPLLTARSYLGGVIVEYVDSVRNTLGIAENNIQISKPKIFPNPVTSTANLEFDLKQQSPVALSINDITGKTVWKSKSMVLRRGHHSIKLDINKYGLSNGSYLINISTKSQHSTLKFIFQ